LLRALEIDLIGTYASEEQLDRASSRFYLTGFSVPREGRGEEPIIEPEDDTESEDAEGEDEDAGAEDVRPAGEGSRRRSILPASMGCRCCCHPATAARSPWRCAARSTHHPPCRCVAVAPRDDLVPRRLGARRDDKIVVVLGWPIWMR
jgi:hypothetical protein